MKKNLLAILACLSLFMFSCSSIEVFKENTEIPVQKNYQSFMLVNQELGIRGFSDEFLDELVKSELKKKLEESGMVYNASKPELIIRYHSNEDLRQREIVNPMNPYPFWGVRMYDPWFFNPYNFNNRPRVTTSNYELLQVILDFIDPVEDKYLMTLTGVTEVSNPKSKAKQTVKSLHKVADTFISLNLYTKK